MTEQSPAAQGVADASSNPFEPLNVTRSTPDSQAPAPFSDAVLLRIIVASEDIIDGKPVSQALVHKALIMGLAGATVVNAPQGFGCSRYIRTEMTYDAGLRVPVSVEIVDADEQIDRYLSEAASLIGSGIVTIEPVQALRYPNRLPGASAKRHPRSTVSTFSPALGGSHA